MRDMSSPRTSQPLDHLGIKPNAGHHQEVAPVSDANVQTYGSASSQARRYQVKAGPEA